MWQATLITTPGAWLALGEGQTNGAKGYTAGLSRRQRCTETIKKLGFSGAEARTRREPARGRERARARVDGDDAAGSRTRRKMTTTPPGVEPGGQGERERQGETSERASGKASETSERAHRRAAGNGEERRGPARALPCARARARGRPTAGSSRPPRRDSSPTCDTRERAREGKKEERGGLSQANNGGTRGYTCIHVYIHKHR